MKRLLITGAGGQLGQTLLALLRERGDIRVTATDADELDITDPQATGRFVCEAKPDFVINCAAYTAVDSAEDDESTARAINAYGPANLATACKECGGRLIHISTDYVFSGENHRPWREDDLPEPRSVYGRTKLEGERAVEEILPDRHVTLRTAWLYSPYGKNFVKTMLRLGAEKERIGVVADQIGTPTSSLTLALAILAVIDAAEFRPGTYHLTDSGAASWYDLASASVAMLPEPRAKVVPITSEEYPARAPRPAFSVLNTKKFTKSYGFLPPHWLESLRPVIATILHNS